MKKKRVLIVVVAVTVLLLCGLLVTVFRPPIVGSRGTADYVKGDTVIHTPLSGEDVNTIKKALRGMHWTVEPRCGFTEDCSVTVGAFTVCFARDDCSAVYVPQTKRYYVISSEGNETIRTLLSENYGFEFPYGY